MFHKRNPQATFPGAQQSAAPASVPGYNAQRPQAAAPRDVRGPTGQQTRPTTSDLNTTTTKSTSEGQSAMNTPNDNTTPQSTPNAGIPGTMPYGRPLTPGMGGGAYGASSHASYNPYGSGRKLIIGEGITMSGEIEHCDHLIVEGTVQATLKDAKLLDISEAGVFYGTVDIEEATIAGRFEGDINVAGRLTVKASGVITGSIRYKELAIEAGAAIEGNLSPIGPRKSDENVAAADFSKGKAVSKQARDAAKSSNDQLAFGNDKASVSAAQ